MHFTCGVMAGAMFQFYGKMFVYCKKDRLKQRLDHLPVPPDRDCVICYETVEPDVKVEIERRDHTLTGTIEDRRSFFVHGSIVLQTFIFNALLRITRGCGLRAAGVTSTGCVFRGK